MEYIRRFCKFSSENPCISLDCIKTKQGFQKCNDSVQIQKKSCKNDDLDRSIHKDISDQELPESEEIFEIFELNQSIYFDMNVGVENDLNADVDQVVNSDFDYFDEYRNHEVSDSDSDSDNDFTNIIIQPVD